jgi:hypothetical protein
MLTVDSPAKGNRCVRYWLHFLLIPLAANALPAVAQDQAPAGWPDKLEMPKEPPGLAEAVDELPQPTLTEPFSIGEALYDPTRIDDAVVSLLALMGVGIDKPDDTPLLPGGKRGGAPFRFTEPEVRFMIELGRADAAAAVKKGRPPYSFRDLHAAVAPLLPEFPVERLAAVYSEA